MTNPTYSYVPGYTLTLAWIANKSNKLDGVHVLC